MNRAVYHFLPSLWGYLDNSYLWLFLDLDRDFNKLNSTPDLPDDNTRKDKDLIMQYRSRMEYLLRPAMLAKSMSSTGADRKDVCSVFVSHSSKCEMHQLDSLVKDVQIATTRTNLATVVNTKEVTPINPEDANCWKVLKSKFDEIISERLESTIKISLASIFLRSLYYGVDKMYITKRELKTKAHLLNISDADFKEFCKVFTSLGSIIDVNLIDENSDNVILRPTDFICHLDKVFYLCVKDPRITSFGIVTESKPQKYSNNKCLVKAFNVLTTSFLWMYLFQLILLSG